jgi:hypothetical protein
MVEKENVMITSCQCFFTKNRMHQKQISSSVDKSTGWYRNSPGMVMVLLERQGGSQ